MSGVFGVLTGVVTGVGHNEAGLKIRRFSPGP